jgi:hypothetical protein
VLRVKEGVRVCGEWRVDGRRMGGREGGGTLEGGMRVVRLESRRELGLREVERVRPRYGDG